MRKRGKSRGGGKVNKMADTANTISRFTDELLQGKQPDYETYLKPYQGKDRKEVMSLLNIAKALYYAGRR